MVVVAICCISLLTPTLASAANKGGKNKGKQGGQSSGAAALIAKYDTNGNGKLDSDEAAKLQADYAAGNCGDAQVFDTNGDKKLDDSETAALAKAGTPPPKHGKKKK